MKRSSQQRWRYIAVDFLTANISFFVFDICRYYLNSIPVGCTSLADFLLFPKLIIEQLLIPLLVLVIYGISGFYNDPERRSRISELITTFLSAIIVSLLIYFGLLVNDVVLKKTDHYELLILLFSIFLIITYTGRYIETTILYRSIRRGNLSFDTVIIGNSPRARKVAQQLVRTQSLYGYNILGYVPIKGETQAQGNVTLIDFNDLKDLVDKKKVSDVIIVLQDEDNEQTVLQVMNRLFEFDVKIKVAAGKFSYLTSGIRLQDIYGEPLLEVSTSQLTECSRNLKRIGDICVSAIALLLLSIPMVIVAIAIKIDSKGPAFYSQVRIGYRRRPFKIHKFRTMVASAEKDGPQLSSPSDNRITRVGHFLRKYRIDELPQFWNVLCGEMALVGPRPERAYYIEKILPIAPYYTLLQQVRPGLTSWGMVKFGYATTVDEMVDRSRFDLLYVGNMSLTVDMKILIYTVRTVLMGKGM